MRGNMDWIDAEIQQPNKSGHYEILSTSGTHGYDDYDTEKKIWWNFDVAYWRFIKQVN